MLDSGKRYFVSAEKYNTSLLDGWLRENSIKRGDEEIVLPVCGRVYELDVCHNDDLVVARGLLGVGYPNFLNGKRIIGKAAADRINGMVCTVIYPEIRDR